MTADPAKPSRFTYHECDTCGFTSVTLADGRFHTCPLCVSDTRHPQRMWCRPARPGDKAEGEDARQRRAKAG
jgi:hypothetical protein